MGDVRLRDAMSTESESQELPETQKGVTADKVLQSKGTNHRSRKRRASRACRCCRERKVRCDVVGASGPCTNCRLDEFECVVAPTKRRKKYFVRRLEAETKKLVPLALTPLGRTTTNVDTDATSRESIIPLQLLSEHSINGHISPPSQVLPKSFAISHGSDHDGQRIDQGGHLRFSRDWQSTVTALTDSSLAFAPVNTAEIRTSSNSDSSLTAVVELGSIPYNGGLPSYIRPPPSRMPSEDVEFLRMKGALIIPKTSLREALWKGFVDYVYPYLPVVDLGDIQDTLDGRSDQNGKISLLLFQAFMFAGAAFVPMQPLLLAGYPTRHAAKKAFYHRARLLYDFDYETDRICLVQSLLLISYWYESPLDQKDSWHWLGIAISLAQTIGLHRVHEESKLPLKQQRLRKRVWWSCYMRDILCGIGMRKPTRVRLRDCNIPMLRVEDFELNPILTLSLMSTDSSIMLDTETRKTCSILCIEYAKICVCADHILTIQYSNLQTVQKNSNELETSDRTTMLLVPKKHQDNAYDVIQCDNKLNQWIAELAPEAIYRPAAEEPCETINKVVLLHRNLLHMVYYTTLSALHGPQTLPCLQAPRTARNIQAEMREISYRKVRHAASEITRLGHELYNADCVKYLPTTGCSVMFPAVTIHLIDIKSPNQACRANSLRQFSRCMQVLQQLKKNYCAIDYVTNFLEATIEKLNIRLDRMQDDPQKDGRSSGMASLMSATRLQSDKVPTHESAVTSTPEHNTQFSEAQGPQNVERLQPLTEVTSTTPSVIHENTIDYTREDYMFGVRGTDHDRVISEIETHNEFSYLAPQDVYESILDHFDGRLRFATYGENSDYPQDLENWFFESTTGIPSTVGGIEGLPSDWR